MTGVTADAEVDDGETFSVYDITLGEREPSITRQMVSQTGYCVRDNGYFFFSL